MRTNFTSWRAWITWNAEGAGGGGGAAGELAGGAGGGAGGGSGEGSGGGEPSWLDAFEGDLRTHVEGAGFADVKALAASHKSLHDMRGVPAERLLTLPDDPSAEGAMDQIYTQLGRPEEPGKYTNALGEGALQDGVYDQFSAAAHKAGLSDKQFSAMQETLAAHRESQLTAQNDALAALKAENPKAVEAVRAMLATAEVGEDAMQAILDGAGMNGGADKLLSAMSKIALKVMSEDQLVAGDTSSDLNMSPGQAKAKITELMSDQTFLKRYTSDSAATRRPAIEQMERLHKIASNQRAA